MVKERFARRATIALCLLAAGCTPDGATTEPSGPAAGQAVRLAEGARLVDLTHPFDETTLYWPTSPSGFQHEQLHHGKTEGGYFYSSYEFCAPEHGGTHLDAPIHFAEGRSTADAIALERLIGPAVVIDFTGPPATSPDALLGKAEVLAFEEQHGAIAPGTIVLVRTDWAERWPDRRRYLGDDKAGDASNLHFPGIGEDAARLFAERKIAAVGIDTASIDHGPSKTFIAHQVLMGADIPAFENVTSMKGLPARGAFVIALPMKIGKGSGGPLRIVAVVPK
jgi:kynurenine formamidase